MAFCPNFHGLYQKYVEFFQYSSLCASRTEQDSNKVAQSVQALARDSFLVSLAAGLVELLTAAVIENWRGKKQDQTGLLSLPPFCYKTFFCSSRMLPGTRITPPSRRSYFYPRIHFLHLFFNSQLCLHAIFFSFLVLWLLYFTRYKPKGYLNYFASTIILPQRYCLIGHFTSAEFFRSNLHTMNITHTFFSVL